MFSSFTSLLARERQTDGERERDGYEHWEKSKVSKSDEALTGRKTKRKEDRKAADKQKDKKIHKQERNKRYMGRERDRQID